MSRRPSVLLTLLEDNAPLAQALGNEISRLGADVQAHFWTGTPGADSLAMLVQELVGPGPGAWVIAGKADTLADSRVMAGLSLAALAAAHARAGRTALPILLSPSAGSVPQLPTPLACAEVVTRGLGARTIARLHTPKKAAQAPYRLNVLPLAGLGLWIECGPAHDPWQGVLMGASGCEPDAQGVGQAGVLPQRCTLKHPFCGMRLEAGGRTFTAWGTGNELSPADSHFVRLTGLPEALVFGPLPGEGDDAELFVLDLA